MDWLSTGHKFSQRYGHGCAKYDDSERSPIFVQVFFFKIFFFKIEIIFFFVLLFFLFFLFFFSFCLQNLFIHEIFLFFFILVYRCCMANYETVSFCF